MCDFKNHTNLFTCIPVTFQSKPNLSSNNVREVSYWIASGTSSPCMQIEPLLQGDSLHVDFRLPCSQIELPLQGDSLHRDFCLPCSQIELPLQGGSLHRDFRLPCSHLRFSTQGEQVLPNWPVLTSLKPLNKTSFLQRLHFFDSVIFC